MKIDFKVRWKYKEKKYVEKSLNFESNYQKMPLDCKRRLNIIV